MVEILVRAETTGQILNCNYAKGFPVVTVANPTHWGGEERPPKFVVVRVTDTDNIEDVSSVTQAWMRKTLYEILAHDPMQDFFRVRIYTDTTTSSDNPAALVTADKMRDFLLDWGAESVEDAQTGGVLFEITAMDAVNHRGLFTFGDEDEFMNYTEKSYDPATGTHVIEVDYATSSVTEQYLISVLTEAGFDNIVVDHEAGKATFNGYRTTMIQRLERAVENTFHTMIARVRYRFKDSVVDAAIANGGVVEMVLADIQSNIQDVAEEV